MRLVRASLTLVWLLSVSCVFADDPGRCSIQEGDRIVFFGDSITAAGAMPGGYISLMRNELKKKHKDMKIELIGEGVSGDTVPDLQRRVDSDVIGKKPTIVFIYIGVNDVWHSSLLNSGTPKAQYENGLKDIIGKIKRSGSRVILCTPAVIGEKRDGTNPLDGKMDEYAEISRRVAHHLHIQLCDLRNSFIEKLKAINTENRAQGILTFDGVHLGDAGNKLVAREMLKSLGE